MKCIVRKLQPGKYSCHMKKRDPTSEVSIHTELVGFALYPNFPRLFSNFSVASNLVIRQCGYPRASHRQQSNYRFTSLPWPQWWSVGLIILGSNCQILRRQVPKKDRDKKFTQTLVHSQLTLLKNQSLVQLQKTIMNQLAQIARTNVCFLLGDVWKFILPSQFMTISSHYMYFFNKCFP